MPYIAVKAFPRTDEAKIKIAEALAKAIKEATDCPDHGISVSVEYVTPEEWDEKVKIPEMDPRDKDMLILHGEKRY